MNPFTILGWAIVIIIALAVLAKLLGVLCLAISSIRLEMRAAKWRKRARIGDKAKFKNARDTWTCGKITRFYGEGPAREARIDYVSACALGSTSIPLDELYPDS